MTFTFIDPIKNIFLKAWSNKRFRQSFSLYGSMIINVILGFGISIIVTRAMGPDDYGKYSYINNLFMLIPILFTFGVFNSGQRLVAQNAYEKGKKKILGTLVLFSLLSTIIMIFVILGYSFFDDCFYKAGNGKFIRVFSILIFVFPLKSLLESYLVADNKIMQLSLNRTMPRVCFFLLMLILFFVYSRISLPVVIVLFYATMGIIYIITIVKLKPNFTDLKESIISLKKENKTYGIHEFSGSILDSVTEKLSSFIILYFLSPADVGYFALAVTLTNPLNMVSSAIGTSFYKDFANKKNIPSKAMFAAIAFTVTSFLLFAFLIKPFFAFFYTKEFITVISIVFITAGANSIKGLAIFINNFISAQGYGKALRNAALMVGISNIVGYMILIKYFGIEGAAYTRLISSLVYILCMFIIYKKILKEKK